VDPQKRPWPRDTARTHYVHGISRGPTQSNGEAGRHYRYDPRECVLVLVCKLGSLSLTDCFTVAEAMELQADVDGNLRHMKGWYCFRFVPLHMLIPYSTIRISENYENDRFAI